MNKVIKHGLQIIASLDPSSQKEMRSALHSVFTEESHIDFNNPENIKGLQAFANMFRSVFEQVGNKNFDFSKIMQLPGPEMFNELIVAAKEFETAWSSIATRLGNGGLKNIFMRDESELRTALDRLTNSQGKLKKSAIENINKSFKEVKSKDINYLLEEADAAKGTFVRGESWEEQSAAALRYLNVYKRIMQLTDNGFGDTSKIRAELMDVFNDLGNIGAYTVQQIESVMPQIQTSLQNIFNLAQGKSPIGLTSGGAIDINVAPKVIKTLDVGDLLGGKKSIEVPVDAVFKSNLDEYYNLFNQGKRAKAQREQLEKEMVKNLPSDMQDKAIDRLWDFGKLPKLTDRNYNAIWKDFLKYGMPVTTGTGGDGSGSGSGDGTGVGSGTGDGVGATPEEVENANKLADTLQRVEAAYKELDALSDSAYNDQNEEEINRILQERLAIIQRIGAENLKAYDPEKYAEVENINDEYRERADGFKQGRDDDIYNQLDENFGYNNDIITDSQELEVLLAKRRELMQGIYFDAEKEYAEQEAINQSIERRIALMKELEPLVANGSITQDDLEEMVMERGELDERRSMLEGVQQNLLNAEPEDLSEAQSVLDQYERIMVKTANGKQLTLGPEMSEADWKTFMNMDVQKAKSIEFVRKEIEATAQAQEHLNGVENQNPPAQDDSGVHNANADATNKENEALQQQKKIINDVVTAKQGLKASQTKLGTTDGTDMFGESYLNIIKEKQQTLKSYLQELTKIEAQEKKNGALTENELARKRELVELVNEIGIGVRYKDGSHYFSSLNEYDSDISLSEQIEQLNQIVSLRKQIALGTYQTGTYGTYADTFSGDSVENLLWNSSAAFGFDIEQFDSSMIGQLIREYQHLHDTMLRCMLVGEEVPQSTLDKMRWFESLDATQLESLLPKLTELQGKIQLIQSQEDLTSIPYNKDDAYYDNKIQDLNTLLALQKEYLALGGPVETNSWDTDLHYTNEELQQYIDRLNVAKQGAQDVIRLKQAFAGTDLTSMRATNDVLHWVSSGSQNYDDAVSQITHQLAKHKELTGKLDGLGSDSTDLSVLESNLEKRKEIYSSLRNEGLLTEQIKAQYDAINQEILEKITLLQKAQATTSGAETGIGTGTAGTTTTPTQTVPDGATSAEAGELETVRAKVQEVINAINLKNKAFYNEAQIVGQVVGKENAALMSLKGNIDAITTAVNTKTQAFLTEQSVVKRVAQSEISAWNGVRSSVTTARVELGNINTALNNVNTRSMSIQAPNLSGTSSQGNIANEAQALADLRARIDEVNTAVQTKTTSFTQEEATVVQSVGNEINALTQLLQNVNNVNTAVTNLANGLNTTLNNAGAFNGINLNVNSTVDLATIEVTLANILTAIPNAGANVQNNNGGGNGGRGGRGAGNLTGRIAVQSSILDNFEAKLMDIGQLTPAVQNQVDQLRTALNNVGNARGLTAWMNQFRTMRSDMNTAGILSDMDTIGHMATRLGQLRANSAQAATSEERASWDALIQQQEAALQHMQQISDVDQDWLDNRALEAYTRSMEKYNDQMIKARAKENRRDQQQTFNQAIKDAQREAGLTKSETTANAAVDTLVTAGQIQGITPEQQSNLDAYRGKIEALKNTIASFPRDGIASEAQRTQLIQQRLEVDAYTKEIQELVANYERLSGDNTEIIGTSALGLGASAGAYQKELTETIIAQTQGRAQIKAYDAETKTLTYTLKTGKGEFTQYAASVRQADGALVSVRGTTTKAMGVFESIGKKIKEYSYYFTGSMMIYRVIAWVREGVTVVTEIDKALTELKKVTDETEASYDRFLNTASKTSEKLGTTIADFTQATATFAKLGYDMSTASAMAEAATVYQNVGDGIENADAAAESIISTIKGFNLEASESMRIVDRFNEVGNRFSITSKGIGDALQRSASALSASGNTLDESIGLITAANEVVQDPESVGKYVVPTLKVAILVKV